MVMTIGETLPTRVVNYVTAVGIVIEPITTHAKASGRGIAEEVAVEATVKAVYKNLFVL
jgi:hypothetical protein